ncbi:hypothetical protein DSO57_1029080 [Entomophthora muscae]|uniref:Uncharacterized protein n=1 Tax=Entomophthora muscae TaxID=34485 RepID=A0ACC2UMK7_9FUNG|nr:hypothetical protein DSO57_1029080 [Entomophthora muscae]
MPLINLVGVMPLIGAECEDSSLSSLARLRSGTLPPVERSVASHWCQLVYAVGSTGKQPLGQSCRLSSA